MDTFELGLLVGIEEGLHPAVVEGVGFHQIYDGELVLDVLPGVGHRKVKPLGMSLRVVVVLQDQLVLVLHQLDRPPQVPRFEPRLEHQSSILRGLRDVVRQHIHVVIPRVYIFGWHWLLSVHVVDDLLHQSAHEADYLDVSFDGLLEHEGLGLVHRVLVFFEL